MLRGAGESRRPSGLEGAGGGKERRSGCLNMDEDASLNEDGNWMWLVLLRPQFKLALATV